MWANPLTPVDRRSVFILVLLGAVSGLAFQGSRGLYESTEGRYAEVGREMAETGRYLEPTLGYAPHWTKPPLTYWAIAAGIHLVGRNAWGARFFNAIAFCLTVLLVALAGASIWDARTGYIAGLVYVSSALPAAGAAVLTTDTFLTLWEVLAVAAYATAYRARNTTTHRHWVRLMWLAFGLGFFTKGPPALLPLGALIVFHTVFRRPFRLADIPGVLMFLVTGFWWYAVVIGRHHELLDYFVGEEIVARSATGHFHRNPQWYAPFFQFLPALVAGPGVWIYAFARTAAREHLFDPRRLWAPVRERRAAGALLLLWFVIPLIVFSVSKSRLILYVLPLYAPLALVIARGHVRRATAPDRSALKIALVGVALIVSFKAYAPRYDYAKDISRLARAAEKAAPSPRPCMLVGESGLYGLQFYLDGRVERLSMTGSQPWSDGRLDTRIERLRRDGPLPAAFVPSGARVSILESALEAAGLVHTRRKIGKWTLVVADRPR